MAGLSLLNKILAVWKRQAFRQKLYRNSQQIGITQKPTVVFAPHQDDETLGCGGLIALKCQQKVPVWVVFLTDGRACYTGAPGEIAMSTEALIQLRQQEAKAALQSLGVSANNIIFLKHQDSQLGLLADSQRQAAIAEIQQLLDRIQPEEVYVPYFNDMHGDHIETNRLVKTALDANNFGGDVWQYLVWSLWRYDYLDDLVKNRFANLYSVGIAPVRGQKNEALKAYQSQYVPVIQNFTALPKTFMRFFDYPHELFVKST